MRDFKVRPTVNGEYVALEGASEPVVYYDNGWPSRPDSSVPVIWVTYDDGAGYWHTDGTRCYIWSLEVTLGGNGDGYHVHRHVICPTREQAERIVAAYASYHDRIQGVRPYRVELERWDREGAAGYLASYLSAGRRKSGSWESVAARAPVDVQRVMVHALHNVRRYDAAGAWRPLGMSPEPTDDPMVLVGTERGVYDAQTYYAIEASKPLEQRRCVPAMVFDECTNSSCRGDKHNLPKSAESLEFLDLGNECRTLTRSSIQHTALCAHALPNLSPSFIAALEHYTRSRVPREMLEHARQSGVVVRIPIDSGIGSL